MNIKTSSFAVIAFISIVLKHHIMKKMFLKINFGELTFHHDGGNRPIVPKKWDMILGDKLKLPTHK